MSENQQNWIVWARMFHRWGVSEPGASLLEAAGSLSVLFAQLLYLSQPLLSGAVSAGSLNDFAQVLENPTDRQKFISLLREAPTSGADV
jgi:hypothetical protein